MTHWLVCVGCGNSSLSEDMYRDGFHNITNVDYSTVVVENMKNRSEEARSMQWLVMDIKDLKFESGSFDIVIEKATLDALLVGERDPWSLSPDSRTLMDDILIQVIINRPFAGCWIDLNFYVIICYCAGEPGTEQPRPVHFHHVRPTSLSQADLRPGAIRLEHPHRDVRRRIPFLLLRHDQRWAAVCSRCATRQVGMDK